MLKRLTLIRDFTKNHIFLFLLAILWNSAFQGERQRRKGRCSHLNAEFQRIARGDEKAFLSEEGSLSFSMQRNREKQ